MARDKVKRDFQNGFKATNGLKSIRVHKGVVVTDERRSSVHDYRDLSDFIQESKQ